MHLPTGNAFEYQVRLSSNNADYHFKSSLKNTPRDQLQIYLLVLLSLPGYHLRLVKSCRPGHEHMNQAQLESENRIDKP